MVLQVSKRAGLGHTGRTEGGYVPPSEVAVDTEAAWLGTKQPRGRFDQARR